MRRDLPPPAFQSGVYHNFYHLTDHLGTVYYLTDVKGNIVTEYDYDEFGIPTKQNSKNTIPPYNPMGYTGEPQHNEPDGLVYLRNRFYEPVSGRFLRRDPVFQFAIYNYPNNPISFIDPIGLSPMNTVFEKIAGAFGGKKILPGAATITYFAIAIGKTVWDTYDLVIKNVPVYPSLDKRYVVAVYHRLPPPFSIFWIRGYNRTDTPKWGSFEYGKWFGAEKNNPWIGSDDSYLPLNIELYIEPSLIFNNVDPIEGDVYFEYREPSPGPGDC